jgi:hypothetical protein
MILACSFISFSISFERFLASMEGSNTNAGKLSVKFLYRRKLMLSCVETRINKVAQLQSFVLESCMPAVLGLQLPQIYCCFTHKNNSDIASGSTVKRQPVETSNQ